jgi:hypothetical protein
MVASLMKRPEIMSRRVANQLLGRVKHGSARLPTVRIDAYNGELRDGRGFVGDRASGRAFRAILEVKRVRMRQIEDDPIGNIESAEISKKELDRLLIGGDVEAAGVVIGTIETFSQSFANVIQRFLRLDAWKRTARIAVGGGLRASRIGELCIGRTSIILKERGYAIDVMPISHDPDEAGLIGCQHLVPAELLSGHDALVAVDIGGANIRVGIVQFNKRRHADLAKSTIWASELWRHADDEPGRDDAVERLIGMLSTLIKRTAKDGLRVMPLIGIGCPGVIEKNGSIKRGGQNLPGDWQHKKFNLPELIRAAIPRIDRGATTVLMHNDAVVQGLSEIPAMTDVSHWGIMTIGSGLGNARFTNRGSATKS